MRKLIIQIPCFNEEQTLGVTLDALPTSLEGVETIERLVIDDGSTDGTFEVAKSRGVEHIIRLPRNRGLAVAFETGLRTAFSAGADLIVNTDADNQYVADDISKLIEPIISRRADIVIGERPITETAHFSPLKKALQKIGSGFVRLMSATQVPDAPSGFRALSSDAAHRLNFYSNYTYALEMIIQAGRTGLSVEAVPIRTNKPTRKSRLFKGVFVYVFRSIATVIRIFIFYRPFRFFAILGLIPFLSAMALCIRWLILNYFDIGGGRSQSLILAAILFFAAFLSWSLGVIGDLLAINRSKLQEILYRLRKRDLDD